MISSSEAESAVLLKMRVTLEECSAKTLRQVARVPSFQGFAKGARIGN